MRDFLLDTQTIRYWYDSGCTQHAAVIGNISALRSAGAAFDPQPKLLISVVTLGEIEFGHRVQASDRTPDNAARRKFVREQLPAAWDVTPDATEAYAQLRSRLFNKYAPGDKRKPKMRPEQLLDPATALSIQIQENDLWLCAQAAAHGFVLVTNDGMKAIRDVAAGMTPPLLMQDWTVANSARIVE